MRPETARQCSFPRVAGVHYFPPRCGGYQLTVHHVPMQPSGWILPDPHPGPRPCGRYGRESPRHLYGARELRVRVYAGCHRAIPDRSSLGPCGMQEDQYTRYTRGCLPGVAGVHCYAQAAPDVVGVSPGFRPVGSTLSLVLPTPGSHPGPLIQGGTRVSTSWLPPEKRCSNCLGGPQLSTAPLRQFCCHFFSYTPLLGRVGTHAGHSRNREEICVTRSRHLA